MGTAHDVVGTLTATITVFDRSPSHAESAIDSAFARFGEIERLADRHRADSEVTRLVRAAERELPGFRYRFDPWDVLFFLPAVFLLMGVFYLGLMASFTMS